MAETTLRDAILSLVHPVNCVTPSMLPMTATACQRILAPFARLEHVQFRPPITGSNVTFRTHGRWQSRGGCRPGSCPARFRRNRLMSMADSAPGSSASDPASAPGPVSIERLMTQLIERAQEVIDAQHRLRRLLGANRAVVAELSLPMVLRRIVEAARDLVGARYAALGVIGADGLLEEFIREHG